jgi:hypothetical protein
VDVDYKYNFEQTHQGVSYRTGADPVIVLHRDRYFLFQTLWPSALILRTIGRTGRRHRATRCSQ